jgi:hypothetical protein
MLTGYFARMSYLYRRCLADEEGAGSRRQFCIGKSTNANRTAEPAKPKPGTAS